MGEKKTTSINDLIWDVTGTISILLTFPFAYITSF